MRAERKRGAKAEYVGSVCPPNKVLPNRGGREALLAVTLTVRQGLLRHVGRRLIHLESRPCL